MRSVRFLSILAVGCLAFATATAPAAPEQSMALASAGPGRPQSLGGYPKHEYHPTKKWVAMLSCGPVSYGLQHWACYHESHKPYAYALEGQIGMTAPDGPNWYSNGFFNFAIGDDPGSRYPVKNVRVVDRGKRAAVDFLWELPAAWVRVRFLLVPGVQPLLCSIAQDPKGETVPKLTVTLRCFPSGYFKDGKRAVDTGPRVLRTPQQADLDPGREWGLVFYDEERDAGVLGGCGGCGGFTVPEMVGSSTLGVGAYEVRWELAARPGGREMRFAFWGGLNKKNRDLVPFLKDQFGETLETLRQVNTLPIRLQQHGEARMRKELAKLLAESRDCDAEKKAAKQAMARFDELRPRLTATPRDFQIEEQCLKALDDLETVLWKLRMKWVFSD